MCGMQTYVVCLHVWTKVNSLYIYIGIFVIHTCLLVLDYTLLSILLHPIIPKIMLVYFSHVLRLLFWVNLCVLVLVSKPF